MLQVFSKNLKPGVPQILEDVGSGFEPVMKRMMSVFEESYLEKEKKLVLCTLTNLTAVYDGLSEIQS